MKDAFELEALLKVVGVTQEEGPEKSVEDSKTERIETRYEHQENSTGFEIITK
jgi:hypothetical protein